MREFGRRFIEAKEIINEKNAINRMVWRVGLRERLKGDVVPAMLVSLVGGWSGKVKASGRE